MRGRSDFVPGLKSHTIDIRMRDAYNCMLNAYNYIMKELAKNRAAILALLLTNPERSFYLQEIGRTIGKKPGVFQRTINRLVQEGILVSEYRANARYFMANKDYPLYRELKSIVFKTVGLIGSIRNALEAMGTVDLAFIYGSYARNSENYLSDIDLVIIGKINEDKLIKKLDRLEDLFKREINFKLYSFKEFRKLVRSKDPFILEILRNNKTMVLGEENDLRKIS